MNIRDWITAKRVLLEHNQGMHKQYFEGYSDCLDSLTDWLTLQGEEGST